MLENIIAPDSMLKRSQILNTYHYNGEAVFGDVWRYLLFGICRYIYHWGYMEKHVNTCDISQELLTTDLPLGPAREEFCCILFYHHTSQKSIPYNIVT